MRAVYECFKNGDDAEKVRGSDDVVVVSKQV
jgi:hypothetical protein